MVKFIDLLIDRLLSDAGGSVQDYINTADYYGRLDTGIKDRLQKIQERLDNLFDDRSWVNDNEYACDVYDTLDYLITKLDGDDITPSVLSDVEETLFKRKPKK